MSVSPYVDEALTLEHDRESFSCENSSFDTWLKRHAIQAQSNHTARTFVWHLGDKKVVGYYSLATHSVATVELPPNVAQGGLKQTSAVLLCKLARDRDVKHKGIGGEMLWNALRRVLVAERQVAARAVVVDAINSRGVGFYLPYGFKPFPENPLRLAMKMSDVARSVHSEEGFNG